MKIAFLLSATSASLLVATAAHAQFSWSNVYATAALSYVDLQREAATNSLITRDSKNDAGVGLVAACDMAVAVESAFAFSRSASLWDTFAFFVAISSFFLKSSIR